MASEEVQGMVVKLGITDDLFTQGIGKINKSMNLLQSEFKASSESLKGFGSASDQLKNKQEYLNKAMQVQEAKIKSLKEGYEKAKTETGEFSQATTTAGAKVNNAVAYFNKMQNELKQTTIALENDSKEMDILGDKATKNGKKTESLGDNFKSLGKKVGIGVLAIGAAFGVALVSGLKMGDDLQKAVNGIGASTDYSKEKMAGMKEAILGVYNSNFGENIAEIGENMQEVALQTHESGKALEEITKDAYAIKDTFKIEIADSVKGSTMLMTQFGMTSKESFNLIAQGAQAGLNKNGDLIDTITEYSPLFKSVGLNADEMFNIMQSGTKAGIRNTDVMADSIKEFGIRTKDGSKTTSEAFAKLGVDTDKMSKAFAKGGDEGKKAFEEVNKKLFEMKDPLAQNQIGVALWGTKFEDVGVQGIKALTDLRGDFDKTIPSMEKINQVKYNDIGSAVQGIKRNLETGILIPLEQKLLPKLSEFSTWFIANMPKIKQDVQGAMDVIIPIFEGFGKAIIFAKDNSGWLIPVLAGVVVGIEAFKVISAINILMEAWKASTIGMTFVQGILNATFLGCPIVWIVLGIGALIAAGVALYMHWDIVSAFLGKCWNGLKETAIWAFNGIADFLKKWGLVILIPFAPFIALPLLVVKHWDKVKEFFISLKNTASDVIDSILGFFKRIKMPDISVKTKWGGPGDVIPYPSFDIKWNAKGGIFTRPTLLGGGQGVGEAGAEAVLPISELDNIVASAIKKAGGTGTEFTLKIDKFINNREQDIEALAIELAFYMKQKNLGGSN